MNRRKRKKILKKHREFLEQIIAILDEIDPVNIIHAVRAAGCEIEREYEPEAKLIVFRMERWNSIRSLETGLKEIFDYYFRCPTVAPEYYRLMARRIWNARLVHTGKQTVDFPDDIRLPKRKRPVIIQVD
jgi:hypothetical protein